MKRLFLFVLILCLCVIAFAQTADNGFSSEEAYYLGRAVAANILSSYKLYNNTELTLYVNEICQALVINSDYTAPYNGYFVMIIDGNEFNAFATPGGHIFITKKLIESLSSEDMLAAVIAHELSHVMLNHGIKVINEAKVENELYDLAGAMGSVAANKSAEAARAISSGKSISADVDVIMNTLVKNGYKQEQEYEADRNAVVLLAMAGYDPGALKDILKVLQSAKGSASGGVFSTHPSPEQRIANVEVLKFRANETSQYRTQRFKSVKF